MNKILVEFRQDWYWFRHGTKIYFCPEKEQLKEWIQCRIVAPQPSQFIDRFRFDQIFDEDMIGESSDPNSSLIAFEDDGLGITILDSKLELKLEDFASAGHCRT